jgi:hypothetical protein
MEVPSSARKIQLVVIRDGSPCFRTATIVSTELPGEVFGEYLVDEFAS